MLLAVDKPVGEVKTQSLRKHMKSAFLRAHLATLGVCLERDGYRWWVSYPRTDPMNRLRVSTLDATQRNWDIAAGRLVDRLCIAHAMVRETKCLVRKDQLQFASWIEGKEPSLPLSLLRAKISYNFPHSTWLTIAQNLATTHGSIAAVSTQDIYQLALDGLTLTKDVPYQLVHPR